MYIEIMTTGGNLHVFECDNTDGNTTPELAAEGLCNVLSKSVSPIFVVKNTIFNIKNVETFKIVHELSV